MTKSETERKRGLEIRVAANANRADAGDDGDDFVETRGIAVVRRETVDAVDRDLRFVFELLSRASKWSPESLLVSIYLEKNDMEEVFLEREREKPNLTPRRKLESSLPIVLASRERHARQRDHSLAQFNTEIYILNRWTLAFREPRSPGPGRTCPMKKSSKARFKENDRTRGGQECVRRGAGVVQHGDGSGRER